MFNKVKIEADLYGIVGLRQPFNPTYQILDAANQVSRSGYFVTDNPYVKVEYIKETQDFDLISDSDFNTQLKQLQQSSIASVMNAVFNKPDFIDRQWLYPFTQNIVNVEAPQLGLLVHKIEVSQSKNIAFEISQVRLNFQGTGTIKLMLFNSSESTPIEEQEVVITSTNQTQKLNWRVDNSGNTYKGTFYLGYITMTGVSGTLRPFKRDFENSTIQADIDCLNIQTFEFVGHNTETLPDLTTEHATDIATGLNLDITIFEDFTDLIVNNEMMFATAIDLDFKIRLIEMYAASSRSNRDQRKSEAQTVRAIAEVEGQSGDNGALKIKGLRPSLLGELNRLAKEINKLKAGYLDNRIMTHTLT